ncbi:kelch repeat-containing protein, partial [Candidatus Zixiibacteriota bacterium]
YDLGESTWTQTSPAIRPSARAAHAMAHIGGDQVLLFGGDDDVYDDETWVFDLSESTWVQQNPATVPSARVDMDMAHIGGDQVLLFGGQDAIGYDDETWVYDLSESTWTLKAPALKPSVRGEYAMAYIGGDRVLLFGGFNGAIEYDQSWLYDLSDDIWIQLSPPSKPSGRHSHAMAYIGGDRVLLFGGYDGADDDESWIFDLSDTAWVQDFNTTQPSARWGFGLSETSVTGPSFPVLFGGDDVAGYNDETWTFGGGDYMLNEAPQVTVTYPNGGETLTVSAVVTWTAADPDPGDSTLLLIDLDYSDNAGTSWVPLTGGEPNDGAYPWDVSGLADGSGYLIRATATDPGMMIAADTCDAVFSIDNPDAPAAIDDLKITRADTSIHLSWTAVTADTAGMPTSVDRYVVYRNIDPAFSTTPADSIGGTVELFYLDSTAALQNISINHFYVVKAVDSVGRRSADSNRVGEIDRGTLNHP